ncbi:CHAT domain-containing protein [Lentzea alba]|uniref:CHAT domain-containing protein n=1 Tax=Lentzea alba TaxID=2714351 RepID=UPI0039BEECD2
MGGAAARRSLEAVSRNPKIFRPEDLAALVADVVLRLVEHDNVEDDALRAADELAETLRDGVQRGLAERRNQYWYWVAAVESALATVRGADRRSARHRGTAFRALRLARLLAPEGTLLPVRGWTNASFEEFWKVSLAVQALAVILLCAPRSAPAEVRADLRQILSIATSHGAARLVAATKRAAGRLNVELPAEPVSKGSPDSVRGKHPAEVASSMIAAGRPDLCEPMLKRDVLAEIEETCGSDGSPARRSAELLEAVAVADAWPFMFGGPPEGWGAVRGDLLFDSLFYRAAAIGAGRRTGEAPWTDLSALVSGINVLWLRELEPDFSVIAGVSCTTGGGWRSSLAQLDQHARGLLRDMASGRIKDLRTEDFQRVGQVLLEPLLGTSSELRALTVMLSPRLRCVPLDALRPGGRELIADTVVSVVPSLVSMATRPAREYEMGDRLRVFGLFDPSLSGAVAEIEVLRDLVSRGKADGVGFTGPVRLRSAIAADPCDLLTVATHGTIRCGVPVLEPPAGRLGLPELLEWSLPAVVNLGACRSAEPSGAAVPLDWVTAALRRGARSVIAARWSVPDRSTSRIISRFYVNLADRRFGHVASAFRNAVLVERKRRPHPWFWAGLGLFGDELTGVHTGAWP